MAPDAPELETRRGARPGRSATTAAFAIDAAILAFNAALIAALWYAVLELARGDRQNVIDAAISRNNNLAIVLEQYTRRTLENADAAIQHLSQEYRRSSGRFDVARFVSNHDTLYKPFAAIVLADARGDVLATAYAGPPEKPVNLADREHFRVHVDRNSGQLFVGKPVTDRVTGRSLVPVTRRVNRRDGSFGGVVMALIEPARFVEVLDEANLRPFDITALVGLDGITRARLRGTEQSAGQDVRKARLFVEQASRPSGHYQAKGGLDGVPRFFSYRTLPEFGLIAIIGTAEADVLSEFHSRRAVYYGSAWLASALIAGFAVLLMVMLAGQRRAAASLTRSHARFLATFNQAAVGIAHTDLDGRYLEVNEKLCRILGYDRHELLTRTFVDNTHPDDVASSIASRERVINSPDTFGAGLREKRYIRKDGSTIWCLVAPSLVRDVDGRPDYIVTVIQDISERKRAEEALRESQQLLEKSFESLDQAVMVVDTSNRTVIECNPATEKIFGYRREEILGRGTAFLHVDDAMHDEFGRRSLADLDATGVFRTEFRMRRRNGEVFPTEHAVTELRDHAGRRFGVVSVVADITGRKQSEAELRRNAERLQQLTRRLLEAEETAKRNINRELHDRVGQNLSILNLSLNRLRARAGRPADEQTLLDDAQATAQATISIVRNVMAELRPPALDDFGLLAALRNHAAAVADRSGLAIDVLGDAPAPRPPLATETALFRIAQEALNNVIKHAQATRARVVLEQDAVSVRLAIEDDGAGFDTGSASPARASWGLGTMQERADAIGARLRIESAPGKGTRVTVEVRGEAAP